MNGTLREMIRLAESGVDAIYLSPERYALLPQEFRTGTMWVGALADVPVKKIIVEDPN